ncbi:ABC transporter substrate-binding protein [Parageobacillus thermoglucosidasius]|uniref:BMP family ABC transporter substrate-binding protein n=2 Tax=Anoxybacillaceae TaxID=3120669 RepID=A0AAN0YMD6_PARTM|nr:ABC transporter substrate binding protein [Parageobacillus thermoglucosidasius C56-YS93]ALF09732.1 ABC transporter substrate-binding protein [Parageobacillus thermoglucosidasius]REK57724.1 MAG: BMP family ABC transporter substrate-binding protein [Geobacillus sp.]ANZ29813.1 BMP family ABC transporter substrate-binding protein [Parageobacillus thermoglucosidasius]APM80551.1 BMP family ABC transporter substrate-binding protein [Parageobacillus thermoglucosidasius]
MMKKRIQQIAMLCSASFLLLSGCGAKETSKSDGNKEKTYQIGVTQFVEHPSLDAALEGFKQALKDKGLSVSYDVQNAQGDMNNNQTIANNFASDQVDLIFANSTPSAQAALNATKDIPIVFTSVTDPVGAQLVQSMEKPGGNVTGTTDTHPDAIPKTVQFIDKYVKGNRVGMIYNSGEQNSVAQVETVKKAMKGTDLKIVPVSVSTSAEVKQAAESLVGKADCIYIITDNTVVSALESVIQVASDHDIPLFVGELDSVKRGGFAAYGFDYYDIGYEAGEMAAQILKDGKKPSDLPVQYPKKLKLLINKKAAKDMNIELNPEWDSIAEYIE